MSLLKKLSKVLKEDKMNRFSDPEHYLERTQVINELVYNNILDYIVDGEYIYVILNYEDAPEYKKQTLVNLGFVLTNEEKNVFTYKCGLY